MEICEKKLQREVRNTVPSDEKLAELDAKIAENPKDASAWINKGLYLRTFRYFREAAYTYSVGLTYCPFECLLYRHRGHAYANIGRYEEGAADFLMGTRLDPSNWDCWYHLGLCYHLMGDYQRAKEAYEGCWAISKDNDSRIACADWYYMTCQKLGLKEEAMKFADQINPEDPFDDEYSGAYYRRVMCYKGVLDPEKVIADALEANDHVLATGTYGLGVMYEANGNLERAMEIYKVIEERDNLWPGFAEHATFQRLHVWNKD